MKKINVKGVDFSTLYKQDYAAFLPAISEMYSKYIVHHNVKRLLPQLPRNREDLDFFNPQSNLFYLPYALYSAGQAAKSDVASHKIDQVTGRDRSLPTTIVGDSGGFQIETGTIKWEGVKTKRRMLDWLERNCDWSMILDFPTGSISRRGTHTYYEEWMFDAAGNKIMEEVTINGKTKKVPKVVKHVLDFWFCLDRTMENNDYFIDHRTPGRTKFLNVLQGRFHDFKLDEDEIKNLNYAELTREEQKQLLADHKISEVDAWYEITKKYSRDFGDKSFEGWSFAGNHKNDFALTLRRIIILLHDGLLHDKKWLHFLGMGKLKEGCVYTSIQRLLRQNPLANPEFTISYDVSSPFTMAAYGRVISGYDLNSTAWTFQNGKMDGREFIGSTAPLQITDGKAPIYLDSPISKFLNMGDVCVQDDPRYGSTWDVASYAAMMNHNVYMHVKAVQETQKLYDLPLDEARNHVPVELLEIKHLVEDILVSPRDRALELIKKYRTRLCQLSVGDGASINTIENATMWEVEKQDYVKSNKRRKEEITSTPVDINSILEF